MDKKIYQTKTFIFFVRKMIETKKTLKYG